MRWRSCVSGVLAGLVSVVGSFGQNEQAEKRSVCNQDAVRLAAEIDESRAYRPRENRCEGQYRAEFAGTAGRDAFLVALYAGQMSFEIDGVRPLVVTWPAAELPGATPVRLLGQSKRPKQYYRMDAEEELEHHFEWPTAVLARVGVTASELAVLGWVDTELGGRIAEVYLPLRLAALDPESPSSPRRQPEVSRATANRVHVEFRTSRDIIHSTLDLRIHGGDEVPYLREKPVIPVPVGRQNVYTVELELAPVDGIHRIDLNLELAGGVPYALTFHCALAGNSDSVTETVQSPRSGEDR